MEQDKIKLKKFLHSITVIKSYRFTLVHKRKHYELYLGIYNGEVEPFEKVTTKQLDYFDIPEKTRKQHYKAMATRLGKVF